MDLSVDDFAADVGTNDPVTIEGAATHGGAVAGVRRVVAPVGITRVDAAEMIVECGAGTPVAELHAALAEVGQTVSIPAGGTVGGALAVGRSDITRLGHGAMRDTLLQTHYVGATGAVTKAGGPTVKNVSGFDLCRLLVGSFGTLGFLADVIVRTRPIARTCEWFTTDTDPFELLASLYRPVSLLWNGAITWVRLDGDAGDVASTAARLGFSGAAGPPPLPGPHRWSMAPGDLTQLTTAEPGTFMAEIGVGVVHGDVAQDRPEPEPTVAALHTRIKHAFDPTGRLNPGIDALAGASSR